MSNSFSSVSIFTKNVALSFGKHRTNELEFSLNEIFGGILLESEPWEFSPFLPRRKLRDSKKKETKNKIIWILLTIADVF